MSNSNMKYTMKEHESLSWPKKSFLLQVITYLKTSPTSVKLQTDLKRLPTQYICFNIPLVSFIEFVLV